MSLVDSAASPREFLARFRDRLIARRVPLSGMLELTSRCNLRCVHCYLGSQEQQHARRADEMTTAEVMQLVDQMVAAGTLQLTLTGGDPMMRRDFADVYRHARRAGLLVTVFCDGVLVTDRIVALFRELPPSQVEVSVYGATAATYEAVTRVPGSFARFQLGVRRLLDGGVPTGLKTVLLALNRHEFEAMEQMARAWGVPFRVDSAVFPCLPDGSQAPLDLRVDPAEAVAKEMADPARRAAWVDYFEQRRDQAPSDRLYRCGAGVTGFYVDPFGELSPCLMTTGYRYRVRGEPDGFARRWRDDVGALRQRRAEHPDYGCHTCGARAACTGCSALFALETGREDVKSDYICQATQHRQRIIVDELERREAGRRRVRLPVIA
jgi:radical SAM protein with 4Fe4S-binding SPASM domain